MLNLLNNTDKVKHVQIELDNLTKAGKIQECVSEKLKQFLPSLFKYRLYLSNKYIKENKEIHSKSSKKPRLKV